MTLETAYVYFVDTVDGVVELMRTLGKELMRMNNRYDINFVPLDDELVTKFLGRLRCEYGVSSLPVIMTSSGQIITGDG